LHEKCLASILLYFAVFDVTEYKLRTLNGIVNRRLSTGIIYRLGWIIKILLTHEWCQQIT